MCLTLALEWVNVRCKYANRGVTCDFTFVGIINVALSATNFDIHIGNVHDTDLDLQKAPGSNANMPRERPKERILSNPKPVTSGVPQWSVLGPIPFVMFVNVLDNLFNGKAAFKRYADDQKLYISFNHRHRNSIQLSLYLIYN